MSAQALKIEERSLMKVLGRKLERKLGKKAQGPAPARSLGVGLIGAGNVARWAYLPRLNRGEFKLESVFDPNQTAAEEAAASFGAQATTSLEALLESNKVEAVFVCTPPQFHQGAAVAALEAGKHVLCEKPLASTAAEARLMWEAAQNSDAIHMIHFTMRFQDNMAYIHQLVHSGILGRIYHLWGTMSQGGWFDAASQPSQERPDAAPWKFGPGGGIVLDLGTHMIDLCRFLFGEVDHVQGWTHSFRPEGGQCEDACGFSLNFAKGAIAHLMSSRWATGHPTKTVLEISGSEGSLAIDGGGLRLWTRSEPRWRRLFIPDRQEGDFLNTFSAAINGSTKQYPNFEDGWKNNEIIEEIFRSAAKESKAPV